MLERLAFLCSCSFGFVGGGDGGAVGAVGAAGPVGVFFAAALLAKFVVRGIVLCQLYLPSCRGGVSGWGFVVDRTIAHVGGKSGVVAACWCSPSWLQRMQRVSNFVSDASSVVAEEMKVDWTSSWAR